MRQVRDVIQSEMDDEVRTNFLATMVLMNTVKADKEEKSVKVNSKTKQTIHNYTESLSSICTLV